MLSFLVYLLVALCSALRAYHASRSGAVAEEGRAARVAYVLFEAAAWPIALLVHASTFASLIFLGRQRVFDVYALHVEGMTGERPRLASGFEHEPDCGWQEGPNYCHCRARTRWQGVKP